MNMPTILEIETRRQRRQEALDAAKDHAERNRLGQFATPLPMALEIAQYVAGLWRNRKERIQFLDPALGTGAFYSAVRQAFPKEQIGQAAGVEVDPRLAASACDLWLATGLEVVAGDFTQLTPPVRGSEFNLLLANPPYVRHHHLDAAVKGRLKRRCAATLGIGINGLAGLYCYFLLLADAWLAPGGLAAWLIPSEFMDVNYGRAVKEYLTEHVKLLHIHRFSPLDVQFSDALVSSAVVIFEKAKAPARHAVTFTLGGTLRRPVHACRVPIATLRHVRKWTTLGAEGTAGHPENAGVTLADLLDIKRGMATGANQFFILPRDKAARLGIPEDAARPILPSPRNLRVEIVDGDDAGYPTGTDALCVIDCRLSESVLRRKHQAFWEYLESGMARGIHEGYLTSRRTPWYSQEARPAAPFLCNYMGRQGKARNPFRFIWNRSGATATNLYLMLYPKAELTAALAKRPALAEPVFRALQSIDTGAFIREGRVYGGGLHKVEPAELGRLPADAVARAAGIVVPRQGDLF